MVVKGFRSGSRLRRTTTYQVNGIKPFHVRTTSAFLCRLCRFLLRLGYLTRPVARF